MGTRTLCILSRFAFNLWLKVGIADSISISGDADETAMGEYLLEKGVLSEIARENDVFKRFNRFLLITDSVHLFDRVKDGADDFSLVLPEKEMKGVYFEEAHFFQSLVLQNQYGIIPEIRKHNEIAIAKRRRAEEEQETKQIESYLQQECDIGIHLATDENLRNFKFYCDKCKGCSAGTFGSIMHKWIDDDSCSSGSFLASENHSATKKRKVQCPNNELQPRYEHIAGKSRRSKRMRRWNEQELWKLSGEERESKKEEILAAGIIILGEEESKV